MRRGLAEGGCRYEPRNCAVFCSGHRRAHMWPPLAQVCTRFIGGVLFANPFSKLASEHPYGIGAGLSTGDPGVAAGNIWGSNLPKHFYAYKAAKATSFYMYLYLYL